jgi:hypothetical protein
VRQVVQGLCQLHCWAMCGEAVRLIVRVCSVRVRWCIAVTEEERHLAQLRHER